MGVVYRAEDKHFNRQVAVKVLSDIFTWDPESLARFEREAKLLAYPFATTICATMGGYSSWLSSVKGRPRLLPK